MPITMRSIVRRATVSILAVLALVVGAAAAPASVRPAPPRGWDAGRMDSGHHYSWSDGNLHVRPQALPRSHSGSPGGAGWRGGDRRTQLAWSQFADDYGGARIMTARGDGSGARPLTPVVAGNYDIDPRISPDGRLVLFERDIEETVQVVVIGVDGRGERVIDLGCSDPCAGDVSPTWGPDGRTIWFTRVIGPFDEATGNAVSAVLWTADLSGRHARRVSRPGVDPRFEEYSAKFLPNGDRVIIRIANPASADDPIRSVLVRVDGKGREVTLTDYSIDADMLDVSPAKSGPTAGLVVFETFGHGPAEGTAQAVATVPSDCRPVAACMAKVRYLTPTTIDPAAPAENYNPTWSPDGTRIAYAHAFYGTDADPTFGADIWTMAWNGKDAKRFTSASEWDFRPDWGIAARR